MVTDVTEKICPSCTTAFTCGGDCWCADFPAVMPLKHEQKCWCQSCFTNQLKQTITKHMEHLSPEKIKAIQALGKPKTIKKGIDYTINEQGAWVFSSWYLLRQGGCCDNGCKNCPYAIP